MKKRKKSSNEKYNRKLNLSSENHFNDISTHQKNVSETLVNENTTLKKKFRLQRNINMQSQRVEGKKSQGLNPSQVLILGFAGVILLGAILLSLPIASNDGSSTAFIDALFTSTSAVCVTGLVVVDTGTYWTAFGKSVILLLIQFGGLGFMTMATSMAMVIGKRISLRGRIVMQEALNQETIQGVVKLTQIILFTTLFIEFIGAVFLSFKFIPMYGLSKGVSYSVFHSISAFCNAGFDILGGGTSLMPFSTDILVNFTIMLLIILGGLGFTVMIDLFLGIKEYIINKQKKQLSLHSRFVLIMTAILLISGFVMVFILEYSNVATMGNMNFGQKVIAASFHAVTPRTAGFNTLSMSELRMPTKFLTIFYMFIGGSPGSTAGGIKTTTFGLVILLVISLIRDKDDIEFGNRRFATTTVMRALALLSIALSIVIFVTFILTCTETGISFLDLLFEAVSAFGTVGLTLGCTPVLSVMGKIIITITMFFGRLGPLTIAMALARRKHKKSLYRYPEGKIMVG